MYKGGVVGRERMYECRAKINIGLSQTKSNKTALDTPESLDWTDKDSLLENLKRWENDEDCIPEGGVGNKCLGMWNFFRRC